jgi:ectoine hydroxylase-related dioxygenase (phytanoyl-CoA dioxygenase family)
MTTQLSTGKDLRFFPADTPSPQTLSRQAIDAYNREGYLTPIDCFDAGQAQANRAFFDRLMARAATCGWDRYSLISFELFCATIRDIITNPAILDVVEDLLGPNFVCFGSHFFCKQPGDVKQITWHQDAPYYELTPSRSLTVWLAIDDVDEENSAMQVIPRSHVHGEIRMVPSRGEEENVLTHTVSDPLAYGQPVTVALKAGQFSVHSDMVLHGSKPNASSRRRCGLAIRYTPVDVRTLTDWNRFSVICRGKDLSGHWCDHPRPTGDRIPVKPAAGVRLWQVKQSIPLDE